MTKLMKLTSLSALILLLSGCSLKNFDNTKPKINETLEVVDSASIRTLPDINAIAFEWRKVDDPRVTGYHFYRANLQKDGAKLKLIDTVENRYTTHYVDEDVEPSTKYVYKISSATATEFESRTTNDYVVSTLPLMEGVSFIQAISNLPRQIKIVWRPHSSERIESYEIQRKTPATSKWEEIETLDGRLQAEYIDLNLEDNVVYHYRVIGKTFDGLETMPSALVKAQTKPLPAGILSLKATTNLPRKIALTWEPSKSNDVVKYNIYRSTDDQRGFDVIKTVNAKTLNYEDFVNEDGKVYFYKVSSIDKDGLESNLNVNSVMGVTLNKLRKPVMTLAQIQGAKAILNWQAGDDRAVSYTVYKTIKEGFFKDKTIKYQDITALRFEDKDIVRGVQYSYAIQAVDKNGIHSEITKETELILPKLVEMN
ncbi:fibronectin type III domain-containing protein [Halarcobacter ebronensis]|uniref:fibronectin type III domain-containing protein n=1 Tax=Halarcobacter ebronensis TaxID=1462615 RepID=UPI003C71746D